MNLPRIVELPTVRSPKPERHRARRWTLRFQKLNCGMVQSSIKHCPRCESRWWHFRDAVLANAISDALDKPKSQLSGRRPVCFNEISQVFGKRHTSNVASGLDFRRDIGRYVVRPMFESVECDDTHRAVELAGKKVADDRFRVGLYNFGFSVHCAV